MAAEQNVQGKVYITFVVEKDGDLSDMKILRDPGAGLGDEALRVLEASPKWVPGVQNGQRVKVRYTVPVNFSLSAVVKTVQPIPLHRPLVFTVLLMQQAAVYRPIPPG